MFGACLIVLEVEFGACLIALEGEIFLTQGQISWGGDGEISFGFKRKLPISPPKKFDLEIERFGLEVRKIESRHPNFWANMLRFAFKNLKSIHRISKILEMGRFQMKSSDLRLPKIDFLRAVQSVDSGGPFLARRAVMEFSFLFFSYKSIPMHLAT